MEKRLTMFLASMLLTIGAAMAQITVKGTVIGADDGEPLPGASVKVVGAKTGTVTDANGAFSIEIPNENTRLEFSHIGMLTRTVRARNGMQIALDTDNKMLDEVIVVGYGTQRREAKTGSISTIAADQIEDIPALSVDKMLAGKMAGVQVTQVSGQPGSASQIRIRGISSINAGNGPLYVIDGIPIDSGDDTYSPGGDQIEMTNTSNPISMINPSDIESITVLKDAAAASIYGSRAANGVILITTKTGKEGKSSLTVRAKYGFSQLANDNNFKMMSGQELLAFQRQAIINAGMNPDDPKSPYYRPYELLTREQTNWMDQMTRTGQVQEYEAVLQGGNAKTKYYSSASYSDTQGVFYGIRFQRMQARINADHEINKWLKTGARVNAAYTYSEDVPMQSLYYANPAFAGMTILPWTPAYTADGEHNARIAENSNQNPRATAEYDQQWLKRYQFNGSMYLEYKPIKQLTFKTNNAAELNFREGRRYWSEEANPGSTGYPILQQNQTQRRVLTTSNTGTYHDQFGRHDVRVLLGQEAKHDTYFYNYQVVESLNPQIPYLNSGDQTTAQVDYDRSTETLISYFGEAEYNYDSRYYGKASLRYDGSSLFGKDNVWGLFWAVSGSWNLHNEKFLENVKWLNVLKLRASYGVNGNNSIEPYQQYGTYASAAYNGITGLAPATPANPQLSWEKNYTWNVGVDFRFWKIFSGSIDVYSRKTTDMLLDKPQSSTSGFNTAFTNIGSLRNTGIEVQLDADIINTKDWHWDVGFNLAHNKSKILELAGEDMMGTSLYRYIVGNRLYTYYLKDYYGVNPVNGEALWYNENGELTNNFNDARYVECGSPEPTITGGLNTTVSWRGLQLSVSCEFKGGNKIFIQENRYLQADGEQMSMNQMAAGLNYWTTPGQTGVNPKPVAGNATNSYSYYNSRFLERGDYFRIKDVTLSYTLPREWASKARLQNAKLYLTGQNVFTFHDVNFWDPERGVVGMGAGIYPLAKTFAIGLDITL